MVVVVVAMVVVVVVVVIIVVKLVLVTPAVPPCTCFSLLTSPSPHCFPYTCSLPPPLDLPPSTRRPPLTTRYAKDQRSPRKAIGLKVDGGRRAWSLKWPWWRNSSGRPSPPPSPPPPPPPPLSHVCQPCALPRPSLSRRPIGQTPLVYGTPALIGRLSKSRL
ncbi:hypothetical protein E2C01_054361 [Portunus trituberculatus]|uniref:Uncharacterized protein n=1 Tax=Portunus trituberculatus TaxID=210409 RepID=A0A5B7GJ63_PORTR|nr:hypothetical protein [Portunus trituberculatus]